MSVQESSWSDALFNPIVNAKWYDGHDNTKKCKKDPIFTNFCKCVPPEKSRNPGRSTVEPAMMRLATELTKLAFGFFSLLQNNCVLDNSSKEPLWFDLEFLLPDVQSFATFWILLLQQQPMIYKIELKLGKTFLFLKKISLPPGISPIHKGLLITHLFVFPLFIIDFWSFPASGGSWQGCLTSSFQHFWLQTPSSSNYNL